MKVCLAQTKPQKGDITINTEQHLQWVDRAVAMEASLIVFPELSLTGYEPTLAKALAYRPNDISLEKFQKISNAGNITIAVGLPTKSKEGVCISMLIFHPKSLRQIYSKQQLHSDELPYFVSGKKQISFTIKDKDIAPAICYESLLPKHAENASKLGAEIYLASVAKPQSGIEKALAHFPKIAQKYKMHVLMVNCVGYCDNFQSVGQTSIWSKKGLLLGQLDQQSEGMLIFDTEKELTEKFITDRQV